MTNIWVGFRLFQDLFKSRVKLCWVSVLSLLFSVGLNKGFLVTKRTPPVRPSRRKGKKTTRVQAIREIIRQVAGFAPYERRVLDLIKIGTAATTKRALKFAKKRLGTHKRGKAKREELTNVAAAMKKKAAA
ncbi:60S Ribosomal protein L36, putative [Eimeria praecox]|uniref:60S ribosomal protein L36 n=1 Tax=Eimeria praecox TaxID=51316 RepID=U6G7I6_9EIME|nr:60S Ribosomal protein L36, putative [Eimeria praecox]